MEYIAHRRYRGLIASRRSANIPRGRKFETISDFIATEDGEAICSTGSELAHQYFARNDDGQGLERGALTQAIQETLKKRDGQYQERWDRLWADYLVWPYRRQDHEDFWVWNQAFFDANIDTLRYIAKLVGADVKGA